MAKSKFKETLSVKNLAVMIVAIGALVAMAFWAGIQSGKAHAEPYNRCDSNRNGRIDAGNEFKCYITSLSPTPNRRMPPPPPQGR